MAEELSGPYARFANQEMILRDELAIDRTILANERTFLAYVRTALAFGIVGASCLKFLPPLYASVTGAVFFAGSIIFAWLGTVRTYRMHRRLSVVRSKAK